MLRTQVSLHNSGVKAARAAIGGQTAAAYVLRLQAEAALGLAIKAENKDLGQTIEIAFKELHGNSELLAVFQQRGMTLTAP